MYLLFIYQIYFLIFSFFFSMFRILAFFDTHNHIDIQKYPFFTFWIHCVVVSYFFLAGTILAWESFQECTRFLIIPENSSEYIRLFDFSWNNFLLLFVYLILFRSLWTFWFQCFLNSVWPNFFSPFSKYLLQRGNNKKKSLRLMMDINENGQYWPIGN